LSVRTTGLLAGLMHRRYQNTDLTAADEETLILAIA